MKKAKKYLLGSFALVVIVASLFTVWVLRNPPGEKSNQGTTKTQTDPALPVHSAVADGGTTAIQREDDRPLKTKPNNEPDPVANAALVIERILGETNESYAIYDFGSEFANLKRLMESGDLRAARTMIKGIKRCNAGVPANQRELEEQIEQRRLANEGEFSIEMQRALYARCGAVTPSMRFQYMDILAVLAAGGDSKARMEYFLAGTSPPQSHNPNTRRQLEEWSQTARQYLDDELSLGQITGLRGFAQSYLHGYLTEQNLGLAYAYYYASTLHEERSSAVIGVMSRLELELSEDELAWAQGEGERIFQFCCG